MQNNPSAIPATAKPWTDAPDVCQELRSLEERVSRIEKQLAGLAAQLPVVERLHSIPAPRTGKTFAAGVKRNSSTGEAAAC